MSPTPCHQYKQIPQDPFTPTNMSRVICGGMLWLSSKKKPPSPIPTPQQYLLPGRAVPQGPPQYVPHGTQVPVLAPTAAPLGAQCAVQGRVGHLCLVPTQGGWWERRQGLFSSPREPGWSRAPVGIYSLPPFPEQVFPSELASNPSLVAPDLPRSCQHHNS